MNRVLLMIMAAVLLHFPAMPTLGATWHVAVGGSGDGSAGDPFGLVQDGLDAAQPGDTVLIAAGTYSESLITQRDGQPGLPITIRSVNGDQVIFTASGRVIDVQHSRHHFVDLVFDGQYGTSDAVRVRNGPDFLTMEGCEVRRTSRDCVDIGSTPAELTTDLLFDRCLIHHCLNPTGGGSDAHGITGGNLRTVTIRDTEIHTFSGDAVQFDPGRDPPGWDDVTIDGCFFWLAPLQQPVNGFPAGVVPGENAVDTKTWDGAGAPRATLTILDTRASGFRNGITNQAAFLLKEKIDALIDGVTVWDSEIAFRLRGPTSRPGAWVEIHNAVIYDVDKAFRYEDDIENLKVWNVTVGDMVGQPFQAAAAPNSVLDVRNFLILAGALPAEATGPSNLAVTALAFADVSQHDYHLPFDSPAVDNGTTIAAVIQDRDGFPRPMGDDYDIGAYEYVPGSLIFADGFESGDTSAWTTTSVRSAGSTALHVQR